MSDRRVRILMAKFGEGYETAIMRLAKAFSEAGFEVIYTDLQNPEAIVASAIQESVDHIGITTLPGARADQFARVFQRLDQEGASHIRVTAGGFLPDDDIEMIREAGVTEFFPKGTTYAELIDWATKNIKATEL